MPPVVTTTSSITVVPANESNMIPRTKDVLNDTNWAIWKTRMRRMFKQCRVSGYVYGDIERPDPALDPVGAENWDLNDNYAGMLIFENISIPQTIHVGQDLTAHQMWSNLEAIHEVTGHTTIINYIRTLFKCNAEEGDDIVEHLNTLKITWERVNSLSAEEFRISDLFFKIIISSSLPPSWDNFTQAYIAEVRHYATRNPFKDMSSQEFIGVIKSEAERRGKTNKSESANFGNAKGKKKKKPSLFKRMSNKFKSLKTSDVDDDNVDQKSNQKSKRPFCKRCKKHGHTTDDCFLWDNEKCIHCNKTNHLAADCYYKDKPKPENKKTKAQEIPRKRLRIEEANAADSDQSYAAIEEVGEASADGITFDASERGQFFNFNKENVTDYSANDESTLYYDWLADSATTSHITNWHDTFVSYEPIQDTLITGVGGLKVQAIGRGDVNICASYGGITYPICLCDVLYVPGNRNNLLSLGRWIAKGGDFRGRELALISKKGDVIAKGTLTSNNLIKIRFRHAKQTPPLPVSSYPSVTQLEQSWDIWHRRFGHVGFSGLQRTLDLCLVTGFSVDCDSPKSDCVACTEAKQSVIPFNKTGEHNTHPGDLTHMDVWGKYDVASINGSQYYLLMVDDASRFVTVEFLKTKDQAAQKVKNYFTHLETQGKSPKAIRIDRGREFLNESLLEWCYSKGMEVHKTAPYSSSQNGVAERMHRTLADLARAMRIAADLPVFLWEYAVAHAAYVRNRVYSSAIKVNTPYERWYGRKPDVTHLREFGAPVWILLQGQSRLLKMEPRSKRRALVGYDDGSKSVLYYSAESRKVLTSRNFKFLDPSHADPERILITPDDAVREGEPDGGTQNIVRDVSDVQPEAGPSVPRKRSADADEDAVESTTRCRTRGKKVDYRHLNDPFSDEEAMSAEQLTNLLEGDDDDQPTLDQARRSLEWPEWERAIQSELDQLKQKGTWRLVEKPMDAVPISNKWVLTKKRDKKGNVVKYKARLVARGFTQRPGLDYDETFLPVVRFETIRALLAMVSCKKLKVRQLDVKGAYLNGILTQPIYMEQPMGFDDGSGLVCLLIKSIYGLKQAG